jgi:hypothetical protein
VRVLDLALRRFLATRGDAEADRLLVVGMQRRDDDGLGARRGRSQLAPYEVDRFGGAVERV